MKAILEKAVQWNIPQGEDNIPRLAKECKEHPTVRSTSYMEVSKGLQTSGCSKDEMMWNWSVMGVIEMPHGKLFVCPNDWVLEPFAGHFVVLNDNEYKALKDNHE